DARYGLDSDQDGLPDNWEEQYGLDKYRNDAFENIDRDYLTNLEEFKLGTNPTNPDTDGDGIPDGDDFDSLNAKYSRDDDRDGIPYEWERLFHFMQDSNPNDANFDYDNDGLTELQEFLAGSNPQIPDSDNDGELDGADIAPTNAQYRFDQDKDGLPDGWEIEHSMQINDPLDANLDLDNDGLSNLKEYQLETHPQQQDSDFDGVFDSQDIAPTNPRFSHDQDFDGIPDQWEVQYGYSNINSADASMDDDNDGLTNIAEFNAGTAPRLADSDNDGIPDGYDPFPCNFRYQVDNDRDGLPAAWEMQYGLSDDMPEDAKQDMDWDNYDNLTEFAAQTDPKVRNDFIPTSAPFTPCF
ncbi:hypothetical protein ACK8OT_12580, partial [Motilimonas sp. KMU-193]